VLDEVLEDGPLPLAELVDDAVGLQLRVPLGVGELRLRASVIKIPLVE
jgi:hypothetical protein